MYVCLRLLTYIHSANSLNYQYFFFSFFKNKGLNCALSSYIHTYIVLSGGQEKSISTSDAAPTDWVVASTGRKVQIDRCWLFRVMLRIPCSRR